MVSCFAADCKHTNESHTCRYFRFPNEFTHRIAYRIWANMCRRTDTNPRATSRLCSCHFPNGVHKIGKEFQFPTIFERKEGTNVAPFGIIPHQEIMERTFVSGPVIVMSSLDPGKASYCKLASGSPPQSDDSEDEPENLVINIKEEPADEENHEEDRRNGEIGDEPDGDMTPHDGEGVATESETDYYKEINLHQIAVTGTSGSVANNKLILSPCIPVPAPNRVGGLRHIRPAPSISGKQDGMTRPPTLALTPGLVPINIDPALPIPVPIALTKSILEKNSPALNNQTSAHHLMTLATEADKLRKKEEKRLQSETGSGSEQGDEGKQSYSDGDAAYSSSDESSGGGVGVDSLLNMNDQTLTLIQRRAAEASLSATGSKRSKRKRSQLPDDMKDGTYWERRRKNNEAAKRSRDSRRAKEDQIAIRAALLEQENMRLRIEVAALKEETIRLRGLLYEKR